MSDDLAQGLLCLTFTVPAVALLVFGLFRRNIGGSDVENSSTVLEEDEPIKEPVIKSTAIRRVSAVSIGICLTLIALMTVVTLMVAGQGTGAAAAKCPLGF